jgi:hypothetical protein
MNTANPLMTAVAMASITPVCLRDNVLNIDSTFRWKHPYNSLDCY